VSGAALISVIVTTYNREDALDAALRALAHQSDRNFEVIIADDGSRQETAHIVENWKARLPLPLKHIRHEHRGFRGGEIRNRGIRASAGEICVFLDGDCLAPADFIAAHRRLAEPGWFVTGNRILLSPELTAAVLARGLEAEQWNLAALLQQRLRLGPLRKLNSGSWEGAQTCNLAVARADLDRIDGFDCNYTGWGLEDSDLVVRLLHAGVRRKDGRFATGVLHLWHPPNDRAQFLVNQARLDEVIGGSRVRASRGLSTLSAAAPVRGNASVAQP
jgi:glycosyltransferase involved in cell wall biosynthesis